MRLFALRAVQLATRRRIASEVATSKGFQVKTPSARLLLIIFASTGGVMAILTVLAYGYGARQAAVKASIYTVSTINIGLVYIVVSRMLRSELKLILVPMGPFRVLEPTRETWPWPEMLIFGLWTSALLGLLLGLMFRLFDAWGGRDDRHGVRGEAEGERPVA